MAAMSRHLEELSEAWNRAKQQWEVARQAWRDEAAQDFEQQYWGPLEQHVPQVVKALEDLRSEAERVLAQL